MLTIITVISFEGSLEALLMELLLEISGPVEPETFKLDQFLQLSDLNHVSEPLRCQTAARTLAKSNS